MSTITKTWSWASGIESWADGGNSANVAITYDGSNGNPAGSLKGRVAGKNINSALEWGYISGTWAALFGIPTDATVTQVRIYGLDTRCTEYTTMDELRFSSALGSSVNGLQYVGTSNLQLWAGRQATAVEGTWTSIGAGTNQSVPSGDQPATTTVAFRLNFAGNTGASTSAAGTLLWDNLVIEITYTVSYTEAGTSVGTGVSSATSTHDAVNSGTSAATGVSSAADTQQMVDSGATVALGVSSGSEIYTPAGTIYEESGTSTASGVSTCTDLADYVQTGTTVSTAVSSASDIATHLHSGTSAANAVSSAVDLAAYLDSGTTAGTGVSTGTDLAAYLSAGTSTGTGVSSGSEIYTPAGAVEESGTSTASGVSSCTDLADYVQSGTTTSAAVSSAADVASFLSAGTSTAAGVSSGLSNIHYTSAGTSVASGASQGTNFGAYLDSAISLAIGASSCVSTSHVLNSGTSSLSAVSSGVDLGPDDQWLTGWARRMKVTIDTTYLDADLQNYQLYFQLIDNAAIGAFARSDGFDLRFTKSDGITLLSHDRINFSIADGKANGNLFVLMEEILKSAENTFYIYYGNASAGDNSSGINTWVNHVAAWHLEESGNGTAGEFKDTRGVLHGQGGAGDPAKTPARSTGKIRYGQTFDVTNDYIQVGYNSALNQYPLSATAWVKTTHTETTPRGLFARRDGYNGYQVDHFATTGPRATYGKAVTNYIPTFYASQKINDGFWHLVKFVVDASGGKIYIDGIQKGSGPWTGTPQVCTTTLALNIGRVSSDGTSFNGSLDQARIATVAHSAAWAKFEYHNESDVGGCLVFSNPESAPVADMIVVQRNMRYNRAPSVMSCHRVEDAKMLL